MVPRGGEESHLPQGPESGIHAGSPNSKLLGRPRTNKNTPWSAGKARDNHYITKPAKDSIPYKFIYSQMCTIQSKTTMQSTKNKSTPYPTKIKENSIKYIRFDGSIGQL